MRYRVIFKYSRFYPQYKKKWYHLRWLPITQGRLVHKYYLRKDAEARLAKFKSDNLK